MQVTTQFSLNDFVYVYDLIQRKIVRGQVAQIITSMAVDVQEEVYTILGNPYNADSVAESPEKLADKFAQKYRAENPSDDTPSGIGTTP